MRHLAVALAALLTPTASRADVIPDGYKPIQLSLHVDAKVPAGKALVLANTFEGGTVVEPGTDQPISWHPMGGPMQLRLVAADQVEALKAAAADLDRDRSRQLLNGAAVCHPPVSGVRTIADTSTATQVRWTYKATITGDTCTSEPVQEVYLDAAGQPVAAPPPPAPPTRPVSAPLADPPSPAAPPPAPSKPAGPPVSASGCGGCDIDEPSPAGLAALALALLLRRRRASVT